MTKNELMDKMGVCILPQLEEATKKEDISAIFKCFMETIKHSLLKGKIGTSVVIPEVGTFTVKLCKARTARNPRTGEKIFIPAKKCLKFKVSQKFKKEVEQLGQEKEGENKKGEESGNSKD